MSTLDENLKAIKYVGKFLDELRFGPRIKRADLTERIRLLMRHYPVDIELEMWSKRLAQKDLTMDQPICENLHMKEKSEKTDSGPVSPQTSKNDSLHSRPAFYRINKRALKTNTPVFPFWIIWNSLGFPPKFVHPSRESARKEVRRLRKKAQESRFYIFEAVERFGHKKGPPIKEIKEMDNKKSKKTPTGTGT